jgi:hypothetical protein
VILSIRALPRSILGARASGSQALRHRTAPLSDELGVSSRAPGRRTRARTDPTWAALGPRTTGQSRTTAASGGQPIAQVSRRLRAFVQVVRAPGLSLARRKSPGPGPRWVRAATVTYRPQRSSTVTSGSETPPVIAPPAQAAGMQAGDSDRGPEGLGFESPQSPHPLPQLRPPLPSDGDSSTAVCGFVRAGFVRTIAEPPSGPGAPPVKTTPARGSAEHVSPMQYESQCLKRRVTGSYPLLETLRLAKLSSYERR